MDDNQDSSIAGDVEYLSEETPVDPKTQEESIEKDEQEIVKALEDSDDEEEVESKEVESKDEVEEKEEKDEPVGSYGLSAKSLEKKFPAIFDAFPSLRGVIYREKQYADVFATIDDAKEAATKINGMERLEDSLLSGSSELLFDGLKRANPKAYESFSDNFLPTLYKQDRESYLRITKPIITGIIKNAIKEGRELGNKNLEYSGMHLSNYIFGRAIPEDEPVKDTQPSPDQQQLEAEKRAWAQARKVEFEDGIGSDAGTKLKSEISKLIDPGKAMKSFERTAAIKEVERLIGAELEKDKQHMSIMNSLWSRAQKERFAADWKPRIISAYLGRARQLLPAVIRQVRNEVLGESGSNGKVTDKKKMIPSNSTSPNKAKEIAAKVAKGGSEFYRNNSDMDILSDNIK